MDPALRELLRIGADDDEVEVVVRFTESGAPPPRGLRLVSRFGAIATARLQRGEIPRVREHPSVASLKAPRLLAVDEAANEVDAWAWDAGDERRPAGIEARGRNVVIGVLDWGLDIASEALRRADGGTRILALWDQRGPATQPDNAYGYGRIHSGATIDAALRSDDPYRELGYDPADADPGGRGAHGTATVDLAAGNGRSGGPEGVAPEAHIVFVHLATRDTRGLANLGDSVGILEALDFVRRVAGRRPTAVSLSVGRHGGPHDGSTLVEQAIDAYLGEAPGRCLAQSAGNYRLNATHHSGVLSPGAISRFGLWFEAPGASNELEVWHEVAPCAARLDAPSGHSSGWVSLGDVAEVRRGPEVIARLYHRAADPQNGSHHVDAFIEAGAPAGEWRVALRDGRGGGPPLPFHAWIERNDASRWSQSRFASTDADPTCTLGTLASGRHAIVCGAYDARNPQRMPAPFSSAGPTRDGRSDRPDVAAPGVGILAVRSRWPGAGSPVSPFVRKSGTSMAAPQVAGCAALLLEASRGALWNEEIRAIISDSASPPDAGGDPAAQLGAGYLDVRAALEHAGRPARRRRRRARRSQANGDEEEIMRERREVEEALEVMTGGDRLFRDWSKGRLGGRFEVLAAPGQVPAGPLFPGDLMVRAALGEPGLGCVAQLAEGVVRSALEWLAVGYRPEARQRGRYAHVVDWGDFPHPRGARHVRRVLDGSGRVPRGQLLLRARLIDGETRATSESLAASREALEGRRTTEPDDVVRFAQRLLAAVEGEALVVDGRAGPLTRAAVSRFQQRYGMPATGEIDSTVELALAQRALEELAQQSLFQKGHRDVETDRRLEEFRASLRLGPGPTLDAATRAALADAVEQRVASEVAPEVTVARGVVVSRHAIDVLRTILRSAGLRHALITSGRRTPVAQARAMYHNLEQHGVENQKKLYGSSGDLVIDAYVAAKKTSNDPAVIQRAMVDKIDEIGPTKVSRHMDTRYETFDVGPRSITNHPAFETALTLAKQNGLISGFVPYPRDPAFHIEIERTAGSTEDVALAADAETGAVDQCFAE